MKSNRGLGWLPRLGLVMGFGLLASVAELGCGGPQKKGDDLIPVSLGDWCKEVNQKLCNSVAQSCFKGMSGFAEGCVQSAMPSCLAGRGGNSPSGRTKGDLSKCVAAIQPLSCKELGQGLGSGKMAEVCGASASGKDAPKPPADEPTKPGEGGTPPAGGAATPPAS